MNSTPPRRVRVVCAVPYSLDCAPSQRYRWEQWAPYLSEHGVDVEFLPFSTPEIDGARRAGRGKQAALGALKRYPSWAREMLAARHADVLVVHRNAALAGPPLLELLLQQTRVPMVYDFDDAIFMAPQGEMNPLRRLLRADWRVDALSRRAALVTPGNHYLAERVRRVTDRIWVLPTTVDTEKYVPRLTAPRDGLPVLGWSGSPSTAQYLVDLLPTLKKLQARVPFELLVVGASLDLQGVKGRCEPWTSASEIPLLQQMDVGLMPLPDDPWTRGKCSLKALLYLAVGIPAVVSDVGTNAEAVPHGVGGYVVEDETEWLLQLEALLTQPELRRQLGAGGRRHAIERYSAKAWAPQLAAQVRTLSDRRAAGS